jgi:hypothetical protein
LKQPHAVPLKIDTYKQLIKERSKQSLCLSALIAFSNVVHVFGFLTQFEVLSLSVTRCWSLVIGRVHNSCGASDSVENGSPSIPTSRILPWMIPLPLLVLTLRNIIFSVGSSKWIAHWQCLTRVRRCTILGTFHPTLVSMSHIGDKTPGFLNCD